MQKKRFFYYIEVKKEDSLGFYRNVVAFAIVPFLEFTFIEPFNAGIVAGNTGPPFQSIIRCSAVRTGVVDPVGKV